MGIRVFENRDRLLAQGFHTVEVPWNRGWLAGMNPVDSWCQQHLQGEYDVRMHRSRQLTGFFRSDADAMLFKLKWS